MTLYRQNARPLGIGIQLAALRKVFEKIVGTKDRKEVLFYHFMKDTKLNVTFLKTDPQKTIVRNEIVIKKGVKFFYNSSIEYAEIPSKMCYFDFADLNEEEMKKIEESEYTMEDVGCLVRAERKASAKKEEPFIYDPGLLKSYEKSRPYKCAYVVYPKTVKFTDLETSLVKHVQNKKVYVDQYEYFVWIDIFCSSQFIKEEEKEEKLVNLSKEISKFSEKLIYFDKLIEPTTLKRLRSVWEVYSASKAVGKGQLSIIFSSKLYVSDLLLLDFDVLIETVLGLDPYSLESDNKEYKALLRNIMTTLPEGFRTVINTIKYNLCSWLTKLVIREYNTVQHLKVCYKANAELYLDVGLYLINLSGNEENAKLLCQKADILIRNIKEEEGKLYFKSKHFLLNTMIKKKTHKFNEDLVKNMMEKFEENELKTLAEKGGVPYPIVEKNVNGTAKSFIHKGKNLLSTREIKELQIQNKENNKKVVKNKIRPKQGRTGVVAVKQRLQDDRSVHASSKHMQNYKDTTTDNDKFYNVYLHFLVITKKYEKAIKAANDSIEVEGMETNQPTMFGGFGLASLYFRHMRQQHQTKPSIKHIDLSVLKKECGDLTKENIEEKRFLYEKFSYYMALLYRGEVMSETNRNHIYQILKYNFFEKRDTKPSLVNINQPFVIGCTRRAAQVFYLLAQILPDGVKKKVKPGIFVDIGDTICKALYGNEEKEGDLELYVETLKDRIEADCV